MTLLLLVNLGFGGGTAATADVYVFHGDLTTVFRAYVDTLHDTALIAADTDTLIANDVDDMIASTADQPDRNTRYNSYLH